MTLNFFEHLTVTTLLQKFFCFLVLFLNILGGVACVVLMFLSTMGDKSVETLCYFGVLKANFPPQPHDSTPSPPNNVGFHVSRTCFFPKQH